MSFPVQDPSNPVDSAVSIASPAPVRRSLRPQVGGNRTEPIKLNAGPSNLQKCENLKYSREQLQALRPSMDNTPPSSVACYRSVVVIADDEIVNKNIGRKKFIELFNRPPGYGYTKSEDEYNMIECGRIFSSYSGGNAASNSNIAANNSNRNQDKSVVNSTNHSFNTSINNGRNDNGNQKVKANNTNNEKIIKASPSSALGNINQLEKDVISILNKITPQTFEKLTNQLCEIAIGSDSMLDKLISLVVEKAIFEPKFSELYAQMCVRLEHESRHRSFIHVVHNWDEGNYIWVKDLAFDNVVAGPFVAVEEITNVVKVVSDFSSLPSMIFVNAALSTVNILVVNQILVKVFRCESGKYYASYIPFSKIDQNMVSSNTFSTLESVQKDAVKRNSFKFRLLNFCQQEFLASLNNDSKYYIDFEEYRKQITQKLADKNLNTQEKYEEEQMLEERSMVVKKRKLGNIQFIGELCKYKMLKVKEIYNCIYAMIATSYSDTRNIVWKPMSQISTEHIELLCQLFRIAGATLEETGRSAGDSTVHQLEDIFQRLMVISDGYRKVNDRIRFTIEELMQFRKSSWVITSANRVVEGPMKKAEMHHIMATEEQAKNDQSKGIQKTGSRDSLSKNSSSDSLLQHESLSAPTSRLSLGNDKSNKITTEPLKEEVVESRSKALVDDYLIVNLSSEVIIGYKELCVHSPFVTKYITLRMLNKYWDGNANQRDKLLKLVEEISHQILIPGKSAVEALMYEFEPLTCLCDSINDQKDAPEVIGRFIGELIKSGVCSVSAIRDLISKVKYRNFDFIPDSDVIEEIYFRFLTSCME
jgi:hypothetical protein